MVQIKTTAANSLVALIAAASLAATSPALGQTTPPSDPHHPPGGAPAQTAPQSAPPTSGAMPAPGTGASGMSMHGGDMPMMGGMHSMMMDMMRQHAMAMAMPGMDMADRVDGRIAFLRAELKITEAQAKLWNDFAQTLRDSAKKLGALRAGMGTRPGAPASTLPQRLDQQEQWYVARTEGIRSIKMSLSHLYGALSDDQKKTADQLMAPHLGLMPMGGMAMGGGPGRRSNP